MTRCIPTLLAALLGLAPALPCLAAEPNPAFDAELARSLGADERGMRNYVLVILKTGPKRMPDGPERNAMFKGHFDNITRLAEAGKLVVAGPSDNVDGWRGIFLFAVPQVEEARALTATDPVIVEGEMVAEFHKVYSSAALMQVSGVHKRLAPTR